MGFLEIVFRFFADFCFLLLTSAAYTIYQWCPFATVCVRLPALSDFAQMMTLEMELARENKKEVARFALGPFARKRPGCFAAKIGRVVVPLDLLLRPTTNIELGSALAILRDRAT